MNLNTIFADDLGKRLISDKVRLDAYKKAFEDFAAVDETERSQYWLANVEHLQQDLHAAQTQYEQTYSELRSFAEKAQPGKFDAFVQMHEAGLIDHTEMVKAIAEALSRPLESGALILPTEGLA